MSATAELRLCLGARADNLALVRQALAGLAEATGIDAEPLGDLKQVATEICMNSIVHGYPGDGTDEAEGEGAIEVIASVDSESVALSVRDWGVGVQPRPAQVDGSLRLGLPLVASLAERFEVVMPEGGGTEVRVMMRAGGASAPPAPAPPIDLGPELSVTAGPAAQPVLSRVLALVASRAGLTLDRMSDGVLLSDAIAAQEADDFTAKRLSVRLAQSGSSLVMRVGPFVEGGAERMLERLRLPELGVSLQKLADRVEVEGDADDTSFVVIEIAAE